MGVDLPLSATRSSRKLAALEFIKRHFAERGAPPSFSEIGAGLGVSRKRASVIAHQLAADKMILLTPRKRRGISLPNRAVHISLGDARPLREEGWVINRGALRLDMPVTNLNLPLIPDLDHIPDDDPGGDLHGGDESG